ncbi:MAG: hypothetical protein IJ150_10265 [Bacteroidales bacterium]|nr:hypothetical protein [Bacteroidales bacterium]
MIDNEIINRLKSVLNRSGLFMINPKIDRTQSFQSDIEKQLHCPDYLEELQQPDITVKWLALNNVLLLPLLLPYTTHTNYVENLCQDLKQHGYADYDEIIINRPLKEYFIAKREWAFVVYCVKNNQWEKLDKYLRKQAENSKVAYLLKQLSQKQ